MFIAAGEVVAAVSGMPWDQFVKEKIFEPLRMKRTVTTTRALERMENVAAPHRQWKGETIPMEWYNWDNTIAAGGIISSVKDMSNWLRLQLNRGAWEDSLRIFSEKSSRTMWTPHISYTVNKKSEKLMPSVHFRGYGLGWGLNDYKGSMICSHGGGYDGMYSRVALVPDKKLGIVVLTNAMTSLQNVIVNQALDLFLGGDTTDWNGYYLKRSHKSDQKKKERLEKRYAARVHNTDPSLPLEEFAGTYGGDLYGNVEVKWEDGQLQMTMLPNPDMAGTLEHWHFNTFKVKWKKTMSWFEEGWVQFITNTRNEVVELKFDVPNDDFWFDEPEFKKIVN